jgi:hypothetical protein
MNNVGCDSLTLGGVQINSGFLLYGSQWKMRGASSGTTSMGSYEGAFTIETSYSSGGNYDLGLKSSGTGKINLTGDAIFSGNVDFGAGKHIRLGTSFAEAMHSTSAGALNFGTAGTINGRTGDKCLDMGANWYFDVSGYDHVKAQGRSAQLRFHADSTNVMQFNVKTSTNIDTTISWTNAMNITEDGTVQPGTDNAIDLGSSSYRWANLYVADMHLKNDRGDWTVIEEEEYLSLKNNKTGKTYKLVMEEI